MWKLPGVIPAKAGIQSFQPILDPGFRRGDGVENQILLKWTALGLITFPHTKSFFPLL
jgi:hypothetical protein